MEAAAVNAYFTPLHYILYLGSLFVFMVVYYEWKWTKVCNEKVLVLVKKADGHGSFQLAPQTGGSVSLKNPNSNTVRLWAINELATIDVPYPGVGFVPVFLQKTIRMVIVDEEDWEPVLNRSAYKKKVASPDIVGAIKVIAEGSSPEMKKQLLMIIDGVSSVPTREMIASPAVLGNLMHEKITEAVITVNKEMMDSIEGLVKRLAKFVTPIMFYIGIGLILIVLLFLVYQILPAIEQIAAISKSLGVK